MDNTQIIVSSFKWFLTDFNKNYCGSYCNDLINQEFSGSTSHSLSTMTIYFTTGLLLDVSTASYGFKDFMVYLYNDCDNTCVTCSVNSSPTSCTSCLSFAQLSGNICTCRDKFYFANSISPVVMRAASMAADAIAGLLMERGIQCGSRDTHAQPNLWWLPVGHLEVAAGL